MTSTERISELALAEWDHFRKSDTVKAVSAFVLASVGAYIQGLVSGQEAIPLKAELAIIASGAVTLLIRHTLAGIEAKQDAILGITPKEPPKP